jgi:hypothetical protein
MRPVLRASSANVSTICPRLRVSYRLASVELSKPFAGRIMTDASAVHTGLRVEISARPPPMTASAKIAPMSRPSRRAARGGLATVNNDKAPAIASTLRGCAPADAVIGASSRRLVSRLVDIGSPVWSRARELRVGRRVGDWVRHSAVHRTVASDTAGASDAFQHALSPLASTLGESAQFTTSRRIS